jgi:hypothetical protein
MLIATINTLLVANLTQIRPRPDPFRGATQSDPATGHPGRVVGGSWEVWKLEDWLALKLVQRRYLMTQTSETFRMLQSTTCSRTGLEPVSRSARGAMFWLDSEASVATAPSGMMKKRKEGFNIFVLLFGVGVALMVNDRGRVFPGNVVDCFNCFVAGFVGLRKRLPELPCAPFKPLELL